MRFLVVIFCILLTGCATSKLWERESYNEAVLGFYLIEGQYEVLAVGEKYSYMFEVEPEMYEAFKLSEEVDFNLDFRNFSVNDENDISGKVGLVTRKKNISSHNIQVLEELGFENKFSDTLSLRDNIYGQRYEGVGELPITKFEKSYYVKVYMTDSDLLYTGRVIATPAALLFDTLVLTPLYLGIVVAYAAKQGLNK